MPRFTRAVVVCTTLALGACQALPPRPTSTPAAVGAQAGMVGEYDNHEQVYQAKPSPLPRVSVNSTALAQPGWLLWRVRVGAASMLEATWLLRESVGADGMPLLTPHRPLAAGAAIDKSFDPARWIALDACALRAADPSLPQRFAADAARCATIAPGLGVEAALLPMVIEHAEDRLRVRLFSDQARGADVFNDTRRVRFFGGWAAINGAGANATVQSSDWHMNRDLRIGNEGGSTGLLWRDGKASGYSLLLERLTYREGNTPVLKLSVIEDASGQAIVYAWADADATRIGINLGWVQVGLEREAASAVPVRR